jgi:hypothetical protein
MIVFNLKDSNIVRGSKSNLLHKFLLKYIMNNSKELIFRSADLAINSKELVYKIIFSKMEENLNNTTP